LWPPWGMHTGYPQLKTVVNVVIPSEARNLTLNPSSTDQSEMPRFAPAKVTSFPRNRESNFHGAEVDPRLRGGDERLTFNSKGGPQVRGHSE
jgi:hypothetical protein